MQQKKLVLVLDLDNTLLHSENFEVGRTFPPKVDCNGGGAPQIATKGKTVLCDVKCPLMRALRKRSKMMESGGFHLLDEAKSLYHMWEPRLFSVRVKLRPFCAVFLKAAMRDYEVHFNTAATRCYGIRILEVLKAELLKMTASSEEVQEESKENEEAKAWHSQI